MRLLVLHPGAMGASVAHSLVASGHTVSWVSAGRSSATRSRAAGLEEADSLDQALAQVDGVISICPPDAAIGQAQQVAATGFDGAYLDANAIAPATARQVAAVIGTGYVDGGIIGPPALQEGTTRLYLSGERGPDVGGWFTAGPLEAIVLPDERPWAASALKMAYAAQTKGSSALLLAVNALAARLGVADALAREWSVSQPQLTQRSAATARGTAPKAWRFEGEMHEIAQTFAEAGLPDHFHQGAAEIYRRMADLKDVSDAQLEHVLAAILEARD